MTRAVGLVLVLSVIALAALGLVLIGYQGPQTTVIGGVCTILAGLLADVWYHSTEASYRRSGS